MLYGGVRIAGRPDLENVAVLDRLPIPMIRRARRVGFAIDPNHFHALTDKFSTEMTGLERDIASYIPPERLHEFTGRANAIEDEEERDGGSGECAINANSAEQISKLLFEMLGVGANHRKLKRTSTGRVSTAKAQLRDLELEHPVVPLVLAFKERSKLKNTYCTLPDKARLHPRGLCCPVCELSHDADTWRVHGECTTTRAETGRIQVKNPPLQTIPQRTENGAAVRAGFVAALGKRLCSVDFNQIELRMMAHLSNCQSMIAVYEAGGDLHDATAMECFGLTDRSQIDKVSHRIPSKTANFLTQYGGSGKALYAQLKMALLVLISEHKLAAMPDWLSEQWCDGFVERWFGARPEVREYLDLQAYRARRYGMVWDVFGRVRLVPEVKSTHAWIKAAGLRQAGNMADQGSSAGLMKLAMAAVEERLLEFEEAGVWAKPIVPVHDQLIVEADEDAADDVLEAMVWEFDRVMEDRGTGEHCFRVPVKSDGVVTQRWQKE